MGLGWVAGQWLPPPPLPEIEGTGAAAAMLGFATCGLPMLGLMFQKLLDEVRYRWRLIFALLVAAGAIAATLFWIPTIAGAAGILLTLVVGVFLNPASHAPPRPRLRMVAVSETRPDPSEEAREIVRAALGESAASAKKDAGDGAIVFGWRRPLDVEAVLSDAVERARIVVPRKGSVTGMVSRAISWQMPPSDEDFQAFDSELEKYREEMGRWLLEMDGWLTERSAVVALEAHLTNRARFDAEGARVVVRFPAGFSSVTDFPLPPECPESADVSSPSFGARADD